VEPATRAEFAGKRAKAGLASLSYRERKSDPLVPVAVIEGNLKPGIPDKGVPDRRVMCGLARGPLWPEVVEVLGPGQWWPGRLGDEDTRPGAGGMPGPGPGPELVGSSRRVAGHHDFDGAGVASEAGVTA
jgi:hypothetical protein